MSHFLCCIYTHISDDTTEQCVELLLNIYIYFLLCALCTQSDDWPRRLLDGHCHINTSRSGNTFYKMILPPVLCFFAPVCKYSDTNILYILRLSATAIHNVWSVFVSISVYRSIFVLSTFLFIHLWISIILKASCGEKAAYAEYRRTYGG